MSASEVDTYRLATLRRAFPDYTPIPWQKLPAESQTAWVQRHAEGWTP